MTEKDSTADKFEANTDEKDAVPRSPRSIRFSDSEWKKVEQAASEGGMTAAVFVRHATTSLAEGKIIAGLPALPAGIVAQIERMYRGVYLLATLKRDEMIGEGRQEELERIRKDARDSQDAVLDDS